MDRTKLVLFFYFSDLVHILLGCEKFYTFLPTKNKENIAQKTFLS
jgi:hypothetical protein